jgi:hypothetical protein
MLRFFPLQALPSNIVEYNAASLMAIANGEFYSEQGQIKIMMRARENLTFPKYPEEMTFDLQLSNGLITQGFQ